MPDEFVGEQALIGTPDRIRERYRAWADCGITGAAHRDSKGRRRRGDGGDRCRGRVCESGRVAVPARPQRPGRPADALLARLRVPVIAAAMITGRAVTGLDVR